MQPEGRGLPSRDLLSRPHAVARERFRVWDSAISRPCGQVAIECRAVFRDELEVVAGEHEFRRRLHRDVGGQQEGPERLGIPVFDMHTLGECSPRSCTAVFSVVMVLAVVWVLVISCSLVRVGVGLSRGS